jgi:hypothetical protein
LVEITAAEGTDVRPIRSRDAEGLTDAQVFRAGFVEAQRIVNSL